MSYPSADELVTEMSNTNTLWESKLDYDLAQEILGHDLSLSEWEELINALDDGVFEIVMSFRR
jgi:hypothetical protein